MTKLLLLSIAVRLVINIADVVATTNKAVVIVVAVNVIAVIIGGVAVIVDVVHTVAVVIDDVLTVAVAVVVVVGNEWSEKKLVFGVEPLTSFLAPLTLFFNVPSSSPARA